MDSGCSENNMCGEPWNRFGYSCSSRSCPSREQSEAPLDCRVINPGLPGRCYGALCELFVRRNSALQVGVSDAFTTQRFLCTRVLQFVDRSRYFVRRKNLTMGTGTSDPLFSIIVPTFNEERLLPRLLESIRDQTFRDYEIIVADDSSTDLTAEIALRYGARLITNNGIGEYPSRNAAAIVAKGSILLFTGADAMMPPSLLNSAATKFFNNPGLAGIYCPTYPYDSPLWAKIEFALFYVLNTLVYLVTREANASTAFFAMRTEIFREIKGFQNVAFADSILSRQLSKNLKITPCLDMVIFVSGRRTAMGITRFNQYHVGMIIGILFKFFRKSRWLNAESRYRITMHTRSREREKRDGR